MKILRITTEVNRSSIGRTTEQIGNLVIENGWESYIAYGRRDGKSSSKKIRIGTKISVYLHVFITRLFDLHGKGSYFSTLLFIHKLKKIKPSLVHLHDIHGYYINYRLLFRYLRDENIPVVWTMHDCWAYTGHCSHYTSKKCYKWMIECNECPLITSYPKSLFVDRSNRNYNEKKYYFTSIESLHIVTVSNWMKSEVEKSFLNKYPIKTIYNGVDTTIFTPMNHNSNIIRSKYNIKEDKIILMGVATSWTSNKGIYDYIALSKVLDDNYVIVMVGITDNIRKIIPSGIVTISRTDSVDELVKIYSCASIILNLSIEESFGKTTIEGLACGVPGIVYNTTASPELVDDKTGRIVDVGDINGIVAAIKDIMLLDRDELMANCRNRALQLFNTNNNYKEYIKLYKEILINYEQQSSSM